MATSKTSSTKSKNVNALASKLQGVATQAKALGINTAKSDAMVAQTAKQGGKAFAGSSFDKGQQDISPTKAISPEALAPVGVPNIPVPKVTDPGNIAGSVNTGLASLLSGMGVTQDTNGMFVQPPAGSAEKATTDSVATQAKAFQSLLGLKQAPESQADLYNKLAEKKAVDRAQKDVNNLTSQLNTITARSQSQQLALEGQGRGQTESFVGGEQARINREAAIAALPVQAQLSAAQGNLEFAQQQLTTMFNLKSADSKAKSDFQNSLIDSVWNFASNSQQNILQAKLADINTKNQKEQANINYLRQLSSQALEYGQSNLISAISGIDPASPTFEADANRVLSRLTPPTSAPKIETAFDKDGNLINMQTGEVIRSAGGGAIGEKQQSQLNETLGLARELLKDEGGLFSGKQSAVGASLAKLIPFGQSLGLQGNRTAFENKVNTLKANLTLDNLSLLKGPMSDKDLAFLQAIGSSISTNMSEAEFNTQVKKVISKLEAKAGTPTSFGLVVTAPDGTEVVITD